MNTLDIILIILLVVGAIKGYQQGFIVEVVSFIAFFVGLFLSLKLTIPVSLFLFEGTGFFTIGMVIVFILLFFIFAFLIKVGARLVKTAIDFTLFGMLDNLLGALAGAFKWAFIASVLFWVLNSAGINIRDGYVAEAVIFPYIVNIGPVAFDWLGNIVPFVRDLMDSIETLPNNNDTVFTFSVKQS